MAKYVLAAASCPDSFFRSGNRMKTDELASLATISQQLAAKLYLGIKSNRRNRYPANIIPTGTAKILSPMGMTS